MVATVEGIQTGSVTGSNKARYDHRILVHLDLAVFGSYVMAQKTPLLGTNESWNELRHRTMYNY